MMSLDRLRYWVRKEITGTESQELLDPDIDELLNFSLWNLETEFDFRTREQSVYTMLVPEQYRYGLDTIVRLDAITSVAVTDSYGNRRKLSRSSRDWFDANANWDVDKGLPTRYLREADVLTIHPVPTEVLELEVSFRQGVESLAEGGVDSTGLPRNWDEIVIAGAVWRGLKATKASLERIQSAIAVTGMLVRGAKSVEEKETKDSRYARLEVIWEHPEDTLQGHES